MSQPNVPDRIGNRIPLDLQLSGSIERSLSLPATTPVSGFVMQVVVDARETGGPHCVVTVDRQPGMNRKTAVQIQDVVEVASHSNLSPRLHYVGEPRPVAIKEGFGPMTVEDRSRLVPLYGRIADSQSYYRDGGI